MPKRNELYRYMPKHYSIWDQRRGSPVLRFQDSCYHGTDGQSMGSFNKQMSIRHVQQWDMHQYCFRIKAPTQPNSRKRQANQPKSAGMARNSLRPRHLWPDCGGGGTERGNGRVKAGPRRRAGAKKCGVSTRLPGVFILFTLSRDLTVVYVCSQPGGGIER